MQKSRVFTLLLIYCIIRIDIVVCSCEKGWESFGSSCYKCVATKNNWQDSRIACQNMAADLVVVKDQEEQDFISSSCPYTIWLGLTDRNKEKEFVWIDNGECSNFSSFGNGEPNNFGGIEDCTILNTDSWNDVHCALIHNFACEKYQDINPPSYGSSCPADDIHVLVPTNKRSVSVYWSPPTWTDDSSCEPTVTCSHFPGHVIEIPDGVLSAFINVTYTARDKAGNCETCYFKVTASVPSSSEYPGLQIPVSSEYPCLQIPVSSILPIPVSSRYSGLTIGMFFVGVIVGILGSLAASFCYKKVKPVNQNRNDAYEEMQYKVKKGTYAVIIKPDKAAADYVNDIKTNKRRAANANNFKPEKTTPAYTYIKPNTNK